MLTERMRLSLICFLIYPIIAGFVTQIGLLAGPVAAAHNLSIVEATAKFGVLTGGFFAGTFLAYFLFDHIGMRSAVVVYSLTVVCSSIGLVFVESNISLTILLGLLGLMLGISTCIAGVVIGSIWEGKRRESLFIGLDASYHVGGLLFPFATTYILVRDLPWEYCLVVVASLAVFIALLSLRSSFNFEMTSEEGSLEGEQTEWSAGVVVAAAVLFLVISAKYFVILWLPLYSQGSLSLAVDESAKLMSVMFSMALVGTIGGMYLVSKIKLLYFICSALSAGFLSCLFIAQVEDYQILLFLSALFGLAISVLYNVFVVHGLSYVSYPTHKHVSLIIVASGLAAAITPVCSSFVVEWFGTPLAAIYAAAVLYIVAIILLVSNAYFFTDSSQNKPA